MDSAADAQAQLSSLSVSETADQMTPDEKIALITKNLQEVLRPNIIEDVIKKENRPLKIYWGVSVSRICRTVPSLIKYPGTATTGRPHCAYFVPIVKIAHFLRAGCIVKVLLADLHAILDNKGVTHQLMKARADYYKFTVTALLKSINVPIEKLEFVVGSSYQRSDPYVTNLYLLLGVVNSHQAQKAGAEVVKQTDIPLMNSLVYPLMQALDEESLGVDAELGGVDQRKIFTLSGESLPKIGYKARAHLMNPMVPGLSAEKMSASDPDSKIDVLEESSVIQKKMKKAYSAPREVDGNSLIGLVQYVLLPISELKEGSQGKFVISREGDSPLNYTDIEALKDDYRGDTVSV